MASATTRITRLLAAAPRLGIDVRVVPGSAWSHGQREVRFAGPTADGRQRVDLRQQQAGAFPIEAVVRAYATARLHAVSVPEVTIPRRGDGMAVAHIVHEDHEHPTERPSLELGAWQDESVAALRTRLQRISRVGVDLIEAIRQPELLASP